MADYHDNTELNFFDVDSHDVPEAPEHWSLEDLDDVVPGLR